MKCSQAIRGFKNSLLALKQGFVQLYHYDIDGLVQECSNFIANAMELLQSCTKPLILCVIIEAVALTGKYTGYKLVHNCGINKHWIAFFHETLGINDLILAIDNHYNMCNLLHHNKNNIFQLKYM